MSPLDTLDLRLPWETNKQNSKMHGRRRHGNRRTEDEELVLRCAVYGVGALSGALLLRLMRRKVCGIPVLGVVATPLLALVPVSLLGALAGATAVYCVEHGDIAAPRKKLLPAVVRQVDKARSEATAVAADLQREAQRQAERLAREQEGAITRLARSAREGGERLASDVRAAAAETERALGPALKTSVERGRREVERSLKALEDAAAGAGLDGALRSALGGALGSGADAAPRGERRDGRGRLHGRGGGARARGQYDFDSESEY